MPIYAYQCDACEFAQEEYQKMSAAPLTKCPRCEQNEYHRVPTLPHTDLKEFHTPIEMFSIALDTDEEIAAFKRQCPDVDVSTDPNDEMYGVPVVRNRKQKLQALDAAGFEEIN